MKVDVIVLYRGGVILKPEESEKARSVFAREFGEVFRTEPLRGEKHQDFLASMKVNIETGLRRELSEEVLERAKFRVLALEGLEVREAKMLEDVETVLELYKRKGELVTTYKVMHCFDKVWDPVVKKHWLFEDL